MPEGVYAEVRDGFATLDFADPSLKGAALARLLQIGPVEPITRDGPRKKYRVPEGIAAEAGLLDTAGAVRGDSGFAAALQAAHQEAKTVPGPDAPTSRNIHVGTTSFADAGGARVSTTAAEPEPEPEPKKRGRPRKQPEPATETSPEL